ncbi:unnamed protein product [Echinostoma caproni]|uniref:Cytidine deaminase n=1 Tax=Echinostoma caproni TaxID=27848 RepID=A0A183AGH6_9TREM|nr:unnamed protein product [Echinostoma caproni]
MSSITDEQRKMLIEEAIRVKSNAYCPASQFPVGCAVLSRDGSIFVGCNVENASFPCGSCAEVGAVTSAVTHGHKDLIAAAVATNINELVSPCGRCRQILAEFMGPDSPVFMVNKQLHVKETTMGNLLPYSFEMRMLPTQK